MGRSNKNFFQSKLILVMINEIILPEVYLFYKISGEKKSTVVIVIIYLIKTDRNLRISLDGASVNF